MTTQIAIVLVVFLAFIALILSGKVQIHVAALMIPIVLEITQVLTFKEAWSGLSNNSVIMMASMFVVGAAVGKTSLISRFSKAVIKPGSSDFKIMLGIALPILFLGCFVNATATMVIMIPMITGICAEQKRPLSKFMYPAAVLAQVWVGWLPTGGNAGDYLASNTIVEELGGQGTWTYFTTFIARIPVMLIMVPLILWLTVKMAPDLGNVPAPEGAKESGKNGKAKDSSLTPGKEKFAIVVFALTIIGIVTCALTGVSTWYPSLVGAFVLVVSGILSDREAIKAMGNPVIYITVGTLPLATALKKTGGDELIAATFNRCTGNMSPFWVMVTMYLICMILTQFITNSAVINAFRTLAALISVQNGFDARALMLCTTEGSSNCYLTPMAAPAMTMGYEAGGYSMKDHLKMGIPLSIVRFLTFLVYIPLVFPLK